MSYKCLLVLRLIIADWSLYEDVVITFSKEVEMNILPPLDATLYLSEPLDLYSMNRKVHSIGYHPTSDIWIINLNSDRFNLKKDSHRIKEYLLELNKYFQLHFSLINEKDELKFNNLLRRLNIDTR